MQSARARASDAPASIPEIGGEAPARPRQFQRPVGSDQNAAGQHALQHLNTACASKVATANSCLAQRRVARSGSDALVPGPGSQQHQAF